MGDDVTDGLQLAVCTVACSNQARKSKFLFPTHPHHERESFKGKPVRRLPVGSHHLTSVLRCERPWVRFPEEPSERAQT